MCNCGQKLDQEVEKEDQKDPQVVPLNWIPSSFILGQPKGIIKPSLRRFNSNESLVTRNPRHSNSIRRCGSFESISPSESFANEGRSYRAVLSELTNYPVNEPAFVDIPTLVAVLIKPENSSQVHSTQIEEVCSDDLLEGLIDTKLSQECDSDLQDVSSRRQHFTQSIEDLNSLEEDFINNPDLHKIEKYSANNVHLASVQGNSANPDNLTVIEEDFINNQKSLANKKDSANNENYLAKNEHLANSQEYSSVNKGIVDKENVSINPEYPKIVKTKRDYKDLASENLLPSKHPKKEKFSHFDQPRERGKLRKQDSVDTPKKFNNLSTSKIFGSVDGLSKRQEGFIQKSHTNVEKRVNSEKSKRLNNINEVEDRRSSRVGSLWRGLGASGSNDSQRKWSNDSDRSIKESPFLQKTKSSLRKYSIDDLKRKTSKDSSSSSSKEDQQISGLTKGKYSRKSSFQDRGSDQDRPHTPIQRNRRAEIVAAVTERLYSSGKRSEEGTGATTPASDYRSPESTDVKLAAVTRMRLQEISRRMLAKRRKISADTQTDNTQTVRVKDKASLTEEPKIEQKDAEVLTDQHEICERLSEGIQVLRVKERATLTEKQRSPTVRCKDAGNITDDCDEDFDLHSPRNDSGILSDDTQNYADSNISSAETLDFGDHERRSTENSTNTAAVTDSVDGTAQTRREDLFKSKANSEADCCHRLHDCCHHRCQTQNQKHGHNHGNHVHTLADVCQSESNQSSNQNTCQGQETSSSICTDHDHTHGSTQNTNHLIQSNLRNQGHKKNCTDKSVISINLPDMINITIESPNILESRISVAEEEELRTNFRDCEVQTDERSASERRTLTEDINRYFENVRPNTSQDGKTFRIENIFQEPKTIRITPDSRITPRIRIVSGIEGAPSRSVIFTKSIGTSADQYGRTTGTGVGPRRCLNFQSPMKNLRRRLSFIRERSFMDSYFFRRSRSFSPNRRTRSVPVASSDAGIVKSWIRGRYPSSEMIQRLNPVQEVILERARAGYLFSRPFQASEHRLWNSLRPMNQYFTTSPGEMNLFDGELHTSNVNETRKADSYFSDDSLDLMEERLSGDIEDLKEGNDPCQPDLVAHTKESAKGMEIKGNVPDEVELFHATSNSKKKRVSFSTPSIIETQNSDTKLSLAPKPIIKKNSDGDCNFSKDEENLLQEGEVHQQSSNVDEEISVDKQILNEDEEIPKINNRDEISNEESSIRDDQKFKDDNENNYIQDKRELAQNDRDFVKDEQNVIKEDQDIILEQQTPIENGQNLFKNDQNLIKDDNLIKKDWTLLENQQNSIDDQISALDDQNLEKENQNSIKKDEEQITMKEKSCSKKNPKMNQKNVLQDYLDEAVTFIRNVQSANDYVTATNFLKKYLRTTRPLRRLPSKNRDYVKYAGQKISLKDDTDQYLIDEDVEIPNKAYEKCLQGIENLEKCIEKVKDHENSLKEKYGIDVEPAGAKLDLATSNQDSLDFLDHQCNNDVDSDNNLGSDLEENRINNVDTYLGTDVGTYLGTDHGNQAYDWSYRSTEGGVRYGPITRFQFGGTSRPQIRTNSKLQNVRISKLQFGSNSRSHISSNYRPQVGSISRPLRATAANYSFEEDCRAYDKLDENSRRSLRIPRSCSVSGVGNYFDDLNHERNCSRLSKIDPIKSPDCFLNVLKEDNLFSKKWKSPASFRHSSLPRLTSSNESISSNETIAASSESIDSIANVREQIKYPGSPRVKFLQLLNERRRIVENSRRANNS